MTDLRSLSPNKDTVLVYPDDFRDSATGDVAKNIVLSTLDRKLGHFSNQRVAVLFRPGVYKDVNFPVGYWTQVLGLGETPADVRFEGNLGVYCLPADTDNPSVGSLDTFWRGAENFCSNTTFLTDQSRYSVPTVVGDDVWGSLVPSDKGKFPRLYPVGNLLESFPEDCKPHFNPSKGMLWAASQAAPMRRIQVQDGNLHLSLGDNCASGGFLGNVNIEGYLLMGSQQQFCFRHCDVGHQASGGAWSMVFVGCQGNASLANDNGRVDWVGSPPHVVCEPSTSVHVEKPFLFLGHEDGRLYLGIPSVQFDSTGANHRPMSCKERVAVDNAKVRVFSPEDTYEQVQEMATAGTHIILSPGTYDWGHTLEIIQSNQVVLGIGMATIQAPVDGSPCIHVSSQAHGVRLSGLSLEANVVPDSKYQGSLLLQWGEKDAVGAGDDSNPGAMHDVYCFVGGRSLERTVQVESMVHIYSSHVVGDNLWLWRADHVQRQEGEAPNRPELSEYHVTTYGECRCDKGLVVEGHHVIFYGLAVEHTYEDMLSWYGKDGRVYFYQSEMPYDVGGGAYAGVTGYRVHHGADRHVAKGVGVYSYFRDHSDVIVDSAVVHEASDGRFENVFTVWLNGYSGLGSVINNQGGASETTGQPVVVPSFAA